MTWTTACPDWEQRIVKRGPVITNLPFAVGKEIRGRESLIPLPFLYPQNAAEGLAVFDQLKLVDVTGKPTLGEASLPWVREFVGHIFGSYEDATGIRHITEYFMLISKKNTKSTTAAGIMLTALILNWRENAEFIILSPTIEVAKNSFEPAAAMVRDDPELAELLHVQDHIRTITHRSTGATLKVVAAANETVSGKKAVGVLVDELWLFGKIPNAATMLREATGGLASRDEGFVIYLTTQSNEPPTGVFKDKLEYARNVRDGIISDNRFLPVIYEFPKAMIEHGEHKLTDNFYVTNPNLGMSVNNNHLLREYEKAQLTSEDEVRDFLAKHLNVEIGMNLRADRWAGADFWEYGAHIDRCSLSEILRECEVVTIGVDGGGLDDLLGLGVIGRTTNYETFDVPEYYDHENECMVAAQTVTRQRWMTWNHAWAHPSVLQRRKGVASKLRELAKLKQLTLVQRIGQDADELADLVFEVFDSGLLHEVGFDPAAVGGILDAILLKGVPEDKMKSVNQGWRLTASIKTAERKLAEGVLIHGGLELMNWCVGNAKTKAVGNAVVITKQVSGSAKIDPLMATFNAVSLMALNPAAQRSHFDFNSMVIAG